MQPRELPVAPPLPRRAKALETTRLRSTTLLSKDGYAVDTHPSLRPGLYIVTKPEATLDKTTGEVVEGYEVDLLAPSCTCKMFEFSRGVSCKHLLATLEHIGHCYNLLAPMLAESKLTIPPQLIPSAPAACASIACPHCGHTSTIPLPDFPGQHVCTSSQCLKTFDEVQSPSLGTRPAPKPEPIKFATAPNPAPPAPKRAGRGIPYCMKCACVMVEAKKEETGQEGHMCMICEAFQPLGSYGPITHLNTGARP
jgi:hypothetical protein